MFRLSDSVRVVDCGDGLTEERTVSLSEEPYPLFHALLRKKQWVDRHTSEQWKAYWLKWSQPD